MQRITIHIRSVTLVKTAELDKARIKLVYEYKESDGYTELSICLNFPISTIRRSINKYDKT